MRAETYTEPAQRVRTRPVRCRFARDGAEGRADVVVDGDPQLTKDPERCYVRL
jgi:hypothetical protein